MKSNKIIWTVIIISVIIIAYQIMQYNPAPKTMMVKEDGAKIKAVIVDENGVVKQELSPEQMGQTFSVISYPNPTGFQIISPATCTSNCNFLAIQTSVDNSLGDSNILVDSVISSTECNPLNSNPSCSSIINVLGLSNSAGTKRGNLNSKYSSLVPFALLKGDFSSPVISDGMALEEVSLGLIDFKINVSGTYRDPFGNDMPLQKSATLSLNIQPASCNDNTPVDPTTGDADNVSYCSTPSKGKYCRVGAEGIPKLTDKASLCGCPNGQYADGENCKAYSCQAGSCIAGTVLFCLDGTNLQTRCYECGQGKCLKDANGGSASSCSVSQNGVESQCVYSGGTGNGLFVSINAPVIPNMNQCGDGIKSGTEQCDKSDFGGMDCSNIGSYSGGSLSCNSDCTYNIINCNSGYVKFRTQFGTISSQTNADGIAFKISTCDNSALTKAGEYPSGNGMSITSNCDSALGLSSYTKIMDITNGISSIVKGTDIATSGFKLFKNSAGDYALAGMSGSNKCIWVGFRESQASAVSTSPYTIDSSKELNC